MVGERRIIALGASNNEAGSAGGTLLPNEAGHAEPAESAAHETPAWDADESAETPAAWRAYLAPVAAIVLTLVWSAFFLWSQYQAAEPVTIGTAPELVAQWAVPVLLIGVIWLLMMRSSRREAARFGDAAALLSRESAQLETRLATINGELSLAREFIASQSRDLETLGRLAVERLTQNADRLQELIRENGVRLDTMQTVSKSALDNMDRLRTQLPVIASSAKDVTNNIGNAGRTAHDQLEDLVAGFNRLNEFGAACNQQVAAVRQAMDGATSEFVRSCEDLEKLAAARFEALAARGTEFRGQLESHEVEALAAIRTRAAALADEVESARAALDNHEAESLTSLRARLRALRDESGVVGRAIQDGETRAAEAWSSRLTAVEQQRTELEGRIHEAEKRALEALRERADMLAARSGELHERLSAAEQAALAGLEERAGQLAMRTSEFQSRLSADEQTALARITAQLAALDGEIAERLAEHERHTDALTRRSETLVATLGDHGQRMAAVAQSGAEIEATLTTSLAVLGERLTASRTTLAATESEVDRLTDASVRLLELIQASAKESASALPEALSVADDRLSRLGDKILTLVEDLEGGSRRSSELHAKIDATREALANFQTELNASQGSVSQLNETHRAEILALQSAVDEVEQSGRRVGAATRDELSGAIEDLASAVRGVLAALDDEGTVKVRALAERLGEESAQAIDKVMRPRAAEAAGALEQAVAHASGAGREMATQMREQLASVEEAVQNLENRVTQARERAQEQVDNDFSRRAALITDSLKSNAIDIAAALSADVGDTAWSAYLRGDRGIFTRRAVSLIEAGEARAIQQLFERDDSFREHVNRYIHDFEALLRQVLSTREGNALGVTLLSSDMGKLYVVLAQGIERLRS
ncbi:ATPase [Novosphingobium sp. M1R2S20]|uniref:ATPase n=1 Tax=Novosphingobium rhizovicinum TaxID=3228928 RepID=A0ABV3R7B0_9SPHN